MNIRQKYKCNLIISSVLVSSLLLTSGCSKRTTKLTSELVRSEVESTERMLAKSEVESAERRRLSTRRIFPLPYKEYSNNPRFIEIVEEVTKQAEVKLVQQEIISEAMSEAHAKLITKEFRSIINKEIKNMRPNPILYDDAWINKATLVNAQTTKNILLMETDFVAQQLNLSAQNAAMQAVESAVKAKVERATIEKLSRKAAKAAVRKTSKEIITIGVILITPRIINVIANEAVDSASKKVMKQIPEPSSTK